MKPLISVIVPAYNAEEFVADTLKSIQSQTFTNFECIIVDDGSTDRTSDYIQPFLFDARFQYIWQENKGLANTRNTGISKAKGKFVSFLDSDDQWLPDMLATQLKLFQSSPKTNLAFTNYVPFFEDNEESPRYKNDREVPHGDVDDLLCSPGMIHIITIMLERELLMSVGGFNGQLRFAEDFDFLLRLSQACNLRVNGSFEVMARYRIRPGSLSRRKLADISAAISVIESAIERETSPNRKTLLQAQLDARIAPRNMWKCVGKARAALPGDRLAASGALFNAWRSMPKRLRWLDYSIRLLVPSVFGGEILSGKVKQKLEGYDL